MITVLVCTYNRCESLGRALDSLAVSIIPPEIEWEVLVVDNNSTDRTREVIEGFIKDYPGRFRYVLEPQQGVSFARNAGIREARGEIVAFIDDDVIAEKTWLQSITMPLRDGQWAGSGGKILAGKPLKLPRWLGPVGPYGTRVAFTAIGAQFDPGEQPCDLKIAPYGTNMAFRKEMFKKYGLFRTDLGRCGRNLGAGEDTEFGNRLLAKGERLRYVPLAVVNHPVPAYRLTKKYLLSWTCGKARSDVAISGIPPTRWVIAGVPIYLFRRFARWTVEWLVSIKPSMRFSCKQAVWYTATFIAACYLSSREAHRRAGQSHKRVDPSTAG